MGWPDQFSFLISMKINFDASPDHLLIKCPQSGKLVQNRAVFEDALYIKTSFNVFLQALNRIGITFSYRILLPLDTFCHD